MTLFQFPRDAAKSAEELAYLVALKAHSRAGERADRIFLSRWRRFLFGPPTHNGRSRRAQQLQNVRPDYHRAFEAERRTRDALVAARRKWLGEEANN